MHLIEKLGAMGSKKEEAADPGDTTMETLRKALLEAGAKLQELEQKRKNLEQEASCPSLRAQNTALETELAGLRGGGTYSLYSARTRISDDEKALIA